MDSLRIEFFFDLSEIEHQALFKAFQYPWEVLAAIGDYLNNQTLGKIDVDIPEGAFLDNPELISIGEGTVVEPGAYIKGPCIIGKNNSIRHGAYIRGNVLVGDNCIVGHTTEAKNTIFLNGAQAGHFAYLGDSILGVKSNVGAGTKFANLKLDCKEVVIHANGETINTQLRKFGAILGDYVQIGCNAVTNPGTIIGPHSRCYPCLNFGGVIPPKSIVKPEQKYKVMALDEAHT
ncbi:MAG: Bifunctional protein GlmU [Chlamydiae bacterium]|nr:Bifunctional protein GlmU [Chlamydiota bacterium]